MVSEAFQVVDDCRSAVRLDDSNLKAFFRGAQASEALGLAEQGLKFCQGALKIDPKAHVFKRFHPIFIRNSWKFSEFHQFS